MQSVTEEQPEPPRAVAHFALLILVGFMVIGSMFLSNRSPALGSFNNVASAGAAPKGLVPDYGDEWSVIIHRSDWSPRVAAALGRMGEGNGPRLGWVVKEWSFLTLPLFGYREGDLAVFTEDSYGYRLVGLTPDEQRAVAGHAGWFPWWRHCWGLLALAAVGAWIWLELRWQAKRRALLGVM